MSYPLDCWPRVSCQSPRLNLPHLLSLFLFLGSSNLQKGTKECWIFPQQRQTIKHLVALRLLSGNVCFVVVLFYRFSTPISKNHLHQALHTCIFLSFPLTSTLKDTVYNHYIHLSTLHSLLNRTHRLYSYHTNEI